MQERLLLEVVPGVPMRDTPECISPTSEKQAPRQLAKAHRDEIFSIINELPAFSSNSYKVEKHYERFIDLLNLYQEQPALLDNCMAAMVSKLLASVKLLENGQTRFDDPSSVAFMFLSHVSKVRGYKDFLAYLPHEVQWLEKVLLSLERYTVTSSTNDVNFHIRYVLLLWMVILCKNPFDFNRFDSKCHDGLSTAKRIINAASPSLLQPVDKCHPVAALLLSVVVTREDAREVLLPETVNESVSALSACEGKSSDDVVLVGNLYLLAAIFKQGRRDDLITLAPGVLHVISRMADLEGTDFVVKRLLVKLFQRLGMVFLKPKIAKWRYELGHRTLVFEPSTLKAENPTASTMEVDEMDEEDYDIPHAELEAVLDTILRALRDRDTAVRWSAAKGIGRIASRLPKHLAGDVLSAILVNNFDELAGNAAWHGACLAIAELSRRGYLALERLPEVVEVSIKALTFEEPQGRHALGANVRDAACYICWALARAFRPSDIAPFVPKIATSLVCTAVFDREVNVRRAASAAFQENVGRQGTFPNGIEVLTLIDYYAVGQRHLAYTEVASEIAKFPLYSRPLIEHLIRFKVTHWDEYIRILSAEALCRLAALDCSTVAEQVTSKLLPLLIHKLPVHRQGGILALSGALCGLYSCGFRIKDEILERVVRIPRESYPLCEKKTRASGGVLLRRAMNSFIEFLSPVIPFHIIPLDDWFRSIELNCSDEAEELRRSAIVAASKFFALFDEPGRAEILERRVRENYILRVLCADVECGREGIAGLLGTLPTSVLLRTENGVSLCSAVVDALVTAVDGRSSVDASWTYGRRACVEAISRIVPAVGLNSLSVPVRLVDCVINALNDYTVSRQGDIGRVLRESAMRALGVILPIAQHNASFAERIDEAVCKIVQQSCEKIDETRKCAAGVLCDLLRGGLEHLVEKETLLKVYLPETVEGFKEDPTVWQREDWQRPARCFKRLAKLLGSPHYGYYALSGFIISAGGLTESTMRSASDALLSAVSNYRDSPEKLEAFLLSVSRIFTENIGVSRVIIPMLCTLDQLFSAHMFVSLEAEPDSSPSLLKIVNLVAGEATAKNNSQKVRLAVTVLCHVLHFNCNSRVWQKAASIVVRTLRSPYPILRRDTAEQLYECLASDCVDEDEMKRRNELLTLLSETQWQAMGEEEYFSKVSNSIALMLNISA